MKELLITLMLLSSFIGHAKTVTVSNNDGCEVQQEERENGTFFYLSKNGEREFFALAYDYTFADFSYCSEESTNVNYFNGANGTGVMISCNANEIGEQTARGRLDLSFDNEGVLTEVQLDGQVKGLFGWKQDVEIECLNLERQN